MPPEKNALIYGRHPILEALEAGKPFDKIFIQRGLKGEAVSEIISIGRSRMVPIQSVPVEKLNKLTKGNHQGVVAFFSQIDYYTIEDILPKVYEDGGVPLFVILDEVTDIRNFGAIARTAACTGVHAIIIPAKGAAPVNAEAIKTSAGALNKIPVCRHASLVKVVEYLQLNGIKVLATDTRGAEFAHKLDFTVPVAIIMGSEDTGVDKDLLRKADQMVKLPIIGDFDSYNVSVAAGMMLYEAVRQRVQQ